MKSKQFTCFLIAILSGFGAVSTFRFVQNHIEEDAVRELNWEIAQDEQRLAEHVAKFTDSSYSSSVAIATLPKFEKRIANVAGSGPLIAGEGVNNSEIGGESGTWANPGYITAKDTHVALGASGAMSGARGPATQFLQATNFGFAIAPDQKIDGIEVTWYRRGVIGTTVDNAVRVIKAGVIGSTDKSLSTPYPSVMAGQTYGGVTDFWGETWSYSDINSKHFGAALSAINSEADSQCEIDYCEITVYHSLDPKHTGHGGNHVQAKSSRLEISRK